MICLVLNVDPAKLSTAQQKGNRIITKNGKPQVMYYTKKKVADSYKMLKDAIEEAWKEELRLAEPDANDAWGIGVNFYYKPKTLKKSQCGKFKTTKPDGENLFKLIPDIITELGYAWKDDAQAQITGVYRRYVLSMDQEPCIFVSIQRLNDPIAPHAEEE